MSSGDNHQLSGKGYKINQLEKLKMVQLQKKNELLTHQLKQEVEKKAMLDDILQGLNQCMEDYQNGKISPSKKQ